MPKPKGKAALTMNQRAILIAVRRKNPVTANYFDIDELMTYLGFTASKQAMQDSLRILADKGLLKRIYEVRRAKKRLVLQAC